MRWSCPHCNADVSLADEKVGTGWFFSRCFRCNGHSLVRRAEVNLIKVDKTPPGENILMTEPVLKEAPLLGEEATQRLAQYIRAGKNPNVAHVSAPPSPVPVKRESAAPSSPTPPPFPEKLQSPPKENSRRKILHRFLPFLTGAIGVVAIGSGAYLLMGLSSLQKKMAATKVPTIQIEAAQLDRPQAATDATRMHASAPQAPTAAATAPATAPSPAAKMWIRVRDEGANLFGGPGLSFPITGSIGAEKRYEVLDWSDRWFKVSLDEKNEKIGWVRNDLVQFVQ